MIGDSIDLARLHARDPLLLTQLVQELSPRIWVAIRHYARDDDDADDMLQDCWTRILERLEAFRHRTSFTAWAITVSRNVCRTKLRRARREGMRTVALEDVAEVSVDRPDSLEELQLRREREIIYGALGKLPDGERDAIVLRVLEGRDTEEAAEILGLAQATVRSLLQRGLRRLRRMEQVRMLLADRIDE